MTNMANYHTAPPALIATVDTRACEMHIQTSTGDTVAHASLPENAGVEHVAHVASSHAAWDRELRRLGFLRDHVWTTDGINKHARVHRMN